MELCKQVIGFLLVACFSSSLYAYTASPIGYWKTIDNYTGQPSTIVKIWKMENQQLAGKIVKTFNQEKNSMIGKVVLGLHDQNTWQRGELLDMNNGHIYPCSVQMTENGKKLNIQQGFFDKQTWERVDLMSDV